jgi:hypothetical protein
VQSSQWAPSEAVAVAAAVAVEVVVAVAAAIVVAAPVVVAAAVLPGSEFCVGAYAPAGTGRFWAKSRANSRGSKIELIRCHVMTDGKMWRTSSPGEVLFRFAPRCCCMDNCCCIGCAIDPRFCNCPGK